MTSNMRFLINIVTSAINTEFGYRHACSNVTYSEAYKSYCSPIASFRNYRLLDLIRADDTNHARVNNYLTNSDLFRTGDTFSMSEYSNCFVNTGLMNSGEALGYEIRFVSVSTTKAVIDITKLSQFYYA